MTACPWSSAHTVGGDQPTPPQPQPTPARTAHVHALLLAKLVAQVLHLGRQAALHVLRRDLLVALSRGGADGREELVHPAEVLCGEGQLVALGGDAPGETHPSDIRRLRLDLALFARAVVEAGEDVLGMQLFERRDCDAMWARDERAVRVEHGRSTNALLVRARAMMSAISSVMSTLRAVHQRRCPADLQTSSARHAPLWWQPCALPSHGTPLPIHVQRDAPTSSLPGYQALALILPNRSDLAIPVLLSAIPLPRPAAAARRIPDTEEEERARARHRRACGRCPGRRTHSTARRAGHRAARCSTTAGRGGHGRKVARRGAARVGRPGGRRAVHRLDGHERHIGGGRELRRCEGKGWRARWLAATSSLSGQGGHDDAVHSLPRHPHSARRHRRRRRRRGGHVTFDIPRFPAHRSPQGPLPLLTSPSSSLFILSSSTHAP